MKKTGLAIILLISVIAYSYKSTKKITSCIIEINADSVLFETSSYVIGANRNHISTNQNTIYGSSDYQVKKPKNIDNELIAYKNVQTTFSNKRKLYRLGHGSTDGRLDSPNDYMKGYHFEDWWGKTAYPYDDIRYGLREARLLDADISMVVNYGTGTPEEAGRLVSYLNNKNDSLRNAQGEALWNVRYFEIGNEVSWRNQRGHDPFCLCASVYARRAKEFATTMRRNSDIPIKIGLVTSINGSFINDNWSNDESDDYMHDIDTLVQIMQDDINFIIFHNYPSLGHKPEQIMSQNTWLQNKIDKKINPTLRNAETKYNLSHPVYLANSEFNSGRYQTTNEPDVLEALYAADNIITAIKNKIEMAVSFCFSSHGFQGMMFFDDDTETPTPVYQLQKLLADHMGDSVIFCKGSNISSVIVDSLVTFQVTNDNVLTSLGNSDSLSIDQLAFVCTKKNDGELILLILNRTEESQTFQIDKSMLKNYSTTNMHLLKGEKYLAKNFCYEQHVFRFGKEILLPGASVALIEIK